MRRFEPTSVLAHAFTPFVQAIKGLALGLALALLLLGPAAEPTLAADDKTCAAAKNCDAVWRQMSPTAGVRAGETTELVLSATVPKGKLEAKIESEPVLVSPVPGCACKVSFRVPEGLKKGEHQVTLLRDGRPLATAVITVYPSGIPTVAKVYPLNIKPGKLITVTGTGLYGPNDRVVLRVGDARATTVQVDPEGKWFSAVFDKCFPAQWWDKTVQISAMGVAATPTEEPLVLNTPFSWPEMAIDACIALAIVTVLNLFIKSLCGMRPSFLKFLLGKQADRGRGAFAAEKKETAPKGFLQSLVYEPQNNTLSLSRAQLVWWLNIVVYCYVFLFIAQHQARGFWTMPPLGNFVFTFLISLMTLVAAQGTTNLKGAKGAGVVSPGWRDLVTNGGVLALERVQQLFWTVIIGIAFVVIVLGSYNLVADLPSIPVELLTLMGLSSTAYVVGKAITKPGPIISQVMASSGTTGDITVKIYGINLSMGPSVADGKSTMPQDAGVRILIDDKVQPVDRITTVEPDPSDPTRFAKVLAVGIPAQELPDSKAWLAGDHTLRLTNADGQHADWEGKFERRDGEAQPPETKQQEGQGQQQPDQTQQADQTQQTAGAGQPVEDAAGQKREPTQDTENRIPSAAGDPAGGKEPPVTGDDEGPDDASEK